MTRNETIVRLLHPLFSGVLTLKRVPKYLRFTCGGLTGCSRSWDALDQLDDTPQPHERIFAAVRKGQGSVHLDRIVKGKRVGEWYTTADYELIDPQPSDETMRSTELWHAWCLDHAANQPAG